MTTDNEQPDALRSPLLTDEQLDACVDDLFHEDILGNRVDGDTWQSAKNAAEAQAAACDEWWQGQLILARAVEAQNGTA